MNPTTPQGTEFKAATEQIAPRDPTQSPTIRSMPVLEDQLNADQQKVYQELENRSPEAIKTENRIGLEIDMEVGEFIPPEIPDFSDMYLEMRKKYGLDQLDQSLADLNLQFQKEAAMTRERRDIAMNQQVGMDVIGGRVGEIERQGQIRMDALGRNISYVQDMHNAALSTVQMIMQFEQIDYQNAFESYKTAFDARMSQFQLKKQLAGEEWDRAFTEKKFQQEMALSNLTILSDLAKNGSWSYSSLSAEQKAAVGKMEVQAGLPVGFMGNIRVDPQKSILNQSVFNSADGNDYLVTSRIDATGNITLEKTLIGKRPVSSGGSGSSSSSKAATEEAKLVDAFWKSLKTPNVAVVTTAAQRKKLEKEGKSYITREQLIKRLEMQHPQIERQDIVDAVYNYYSN